MPGTKLGGLKAAETNKKRHGEDFYKKLGARGGAASTTGGFAYWKAQGMEEKIREAGKKGGVISRRSRNEN
jgi:hypothetical protein